MDGWVESSFAYEGRSYPTYRRGAGPGVVVIHEIPGITPKVKKFAEDVVDDLLASVHGVQKKRTVSPVYDTEDIT